MARAYVQYLLCCYDIYSIFYIPVNFALNLPHYVTSYMHHRVKKKKKQKGYEKLPSESVGTKS